MMDRRTHDGPSSGTRRVINEAYPTRPGWVFFRKNSQHIKPPTLDFTPFLPSSYYSLPFQLPKSSPSSTDHFPQILQSPKSPHLLVGAAAVGVFLITKYLSLLFFSNSQVCVSNFYSFILHFCLSISIILVLLDRFIL